MDFVKLKKYLNKNNIYLFDSDYRIVHFRLNNIQNIFNKTQTGGSYVIKKVKKINARQNAPTVYDINASIYIWTRKALTNKKSFFSKNTGIYVMPRVRSVDIDDKDDWNLVNFYLKKNEKY